MPVIGCTPSIRACQRWLAAWKRQNRRLHAHLANPDAAKGRYRPAFGDAGQAVARLNQVWEFDDTPSDIVLADGQRYAVIGVIDVWSRRMILQVHRTSTAHGISLLMRRALLTWGVPEMMRTDNGAAYVSQHITAVLRRLDWLGQVSYADARGPAPDGAPPLDRGRPLEEMHVLTPDRRRAFAGFAAFRWLAWRLPLLWPVLPLLYLPGADELGQRAYLWVARNRFQLVPCHGGVCAMPPRPR